MLKLQRPKTLSSCLLASAAQHLIGICKYYTGKMKRRTGLALDSITPERVSAVSPRYSSLPLLDLDLLVPTKKSVRL